MSVYPYGPRGTSTVLNSSNPRDQSDSPYYIPRAGAGQYDPVGWQTQFGGSGVASTVQPPVVSGGAVPGGSATNLGQYINAIPNYLALLNQSGKNIQNRLAGDISDLVPQLSQGAAEFGAGMGIAGSPAANSKYLRDLGLTKYQVEQTALGDIGRLGAAVPTNPYGDFALTPYQQQELQLQQQQLAQQLQIERMREANTNLANRYRGRSPASSGGYGGGGNAAPGFGTPTTGTGNQSTSDLNRMIDQYLNRLGLGAGSGKAKIGGSLLSPGDVDYRYTGDPSNAVGPSWDIGTNEFINQQFADNPDYYE